MSNVNEGHEELSNLVRTAHHWRYRLQDPDLSEGDRKAFQAWVDADIRHEEAYDRAVTIWAAFDRLEPSDIAPDLMRPTARERWRRLQKHARSFYGMREFRLATAATLLILITVAIMLPITLNHMPTDVAAVTHASEKGKTISMTLADGSSVTLGPATTIETMLSDTHRQVRLTGGAALFEVASDPDRPFSVATGDLTATVVGTRFDVRNNGGIARVAVAEGKVRVTYPYMIGSYKLWMNHGEVLEAGEQIAVTQKEGLRSVRPIAPDKVGAWAWADATLIYDGATIAELVADANRYYEGEITLADDAGHIADLTITASFSTDDIDRLLSLVEMSFPVELDKTEPDRVILRHKGSR